MKDLVVFVVCCLFLTATFGCDKSTEALIEEGKNMKNPVSAMETLQMAVDNSKTEKEKVYALNALAWLYATSPDLTVQNGSKAVELAEQSMKLSNDLNINSFNAMVSQAAAHARKGNFQQAAKIEAYLGKILQRKSVQAGGNPRSPEWEKSNERYKTYKAGKAWTEKPKD